MSEKNFGQLGATFQESLLKTIIEEKKFATTIIDVIDSKYFDTPYFKYLMQSIKEFYVNHKTIPTYTSLREKVLSENSKDTTAQVHLDTLTHIQELEVRDVSWIKTTASNFCKQQVLKKVFSNALKAINTGTFDECPDIEKDVIDAYQIGTTTEEITDIFINPEAVLELDARVPIPTGIDGLDSLLKGGLAKGEFGVVIAPLGTGKTTLATLFANSAFNCGHHVLQMFFEDNQNTIKRKHFTKWTGITPDDLGLPENRENVLRTVREKMAASSGSLNLAKYPSGSTTVSQIKSKLRRLHAEGTVIDLLIVDYVECLAPERMGSEDEWKGEGAIMRQLDAMTSEFNIAIWVTTQGSRESISSEIVTSDQIGGSIKKAQIGHVVISVAKTLEQKEHKIPTMALLKSRIGKDGVIFTNCTFDNEFLIINTESQNTLLGFKEEKAIARAKRPADLYKATVDNKNGEI